MKDLQKQNIRLTSDVLLTRFRIIFVCALTLLMCDRFRAKCLLLTSRIIIK